MLRLSKYRWEDIGLSSRGLLFRIVDNILVDRYRSAQRRPEELRDDEMDARESCMAEPIQGDIDRHLDIMEALNAIPKEYSAAVTLRIEGIETSEIANMLGIRDGTVFSRISRGIDLLQQLLVK